MTPKVSSNKCNLCGIPEQHFKQPSPHHWAAIAETGGAGALWTANRRRKEDVFLSAKGEEKRVSFGTSVCNHQLEKASQSPLKRQTEGNERKTSREQRKEGFFSCRKGTFTIFRCGKGKPGWRSRNWGTGFKKLVGYDFYPPLNRFKHLILCICTMEPPFGFCSGAVRHALIRLTSLKEFQ